MSSKLAKLFHLKPSEDQEAAGTLGKLRTVAEFLGDAAEKLKKNATAADVLKAIQESAPWAGALVESLGESLPVVRFFVNFVSKLTEEHDANRLGLLACALAYQKAVEETLTELAGPEAPRPAGPELKKRLRELDDGIERLDFTRFSYAGATGHEFTHRAEAAFDAYAEAVGYSEAARRKLLLTTREKFIPTLKKLLADGKTHEKLAPFSRLLQGGTDEARAFATLAAHREEQRRLYEMAPVFRKEPFALADVYIETECGVLTWGQLRDSCQPAETGGPRTSVTPIDPFADTPRGGGRHPLLETVLGLLQEPAFREAIVIQGAAGAGKSSFTLRLVAELIKEGLRPIRVRLRDLRPDLPILEALGQALFPADPERRPPNAEDRLPDPLRNGELFREGIPFGEKQICPYVLILDGWDEISISASEGFKARVERMLEKVRNEFLGNKYPYPVRVILTGRPSDAVAASQFLRATTPLLTLRPLRPDQLRDFVTALSTALETRPVPVPDGADVWNIPDLDVFTPIFAAYERDFEAEVRRQTRAAGTTTPTLPTPGDSERNPTLDVLGLPLLAHLAVRLIARLPAGEAEELVNNSTTLLRSLVDLTCGKAGKPTDDADDLDAQRRVTGGRLRELLRRTAATMTASGQESISYGELSRRLDLDDGSLDQHVGQTTRDHPLTALMISFFFKGGHADLGCEFLHKSFREYLFAECIVECLKDYGRTAPDGLPERERFWQDFAGDDPRHRFSRDLSKLLAPQWLGLEVVEHLSRLAFWEAARSFPSVPAAAELPSGTLGLTTAPLSGEEWRRVRDGLADLWDWWVQDAPQRPQPEVDRKTREVSYRPAYAQELAEDSLPYDPARRQATAETPAFSILDAHLGDGLFRLTAAAHYVVALHTGWLGGPNAKSDLGWSAEEAWRGAKPPGEEARRCQTCVTNERGRWWLFAPGGTSPQQFNTCILAINGGGNRPGGFFPRSTMMWGVDLHGAFLHLGYSGRYDPELPTNDRGAVWFNTNLAGAQLTGGDLSGHRFHRTLADDANFAVANCTGAYFFSTALRNANFTGTWAQGAVFLEADMEGLRAVGAEFGGSHWSNTDHAKATFQNCRFQGARGNHPNSRSAVAKAVAARPKHP